MFFDLLPGAGYVCAHRGARALAPENTMLAVRLAFESGADFWELDVQKTTDGALVVFHDDFLERTTDAAERFPERSPWSIYDFTLEELRSLDAGAWFMRKDPHGSIAKGDVPPENQKQMQGQRIPTLQEALEYSRACGLPFNLEIKDQLNTPGDLRIVSEVHAALVEAGVRDMALVSSFNHDYLRELRRVDPALPLGALVEDSHPEDLERYLDELGVCCYHPDYEITSLELVRDLTGRGIKVSPYTVNDMDRARELLDAGCYSIITDFPHTLRKLLG